MFFITADFISGESTLDSSIYTLVVQAKSRARQFFDKWMEIQSKQESWIPKLSERGLSWNQDADKTHNTITL